MKVTPYDLAKERGLLDVWIVARTPRTRRYPCRCVLARTCHPVWCPCSGRLDTDGLPSHCCSTTNTPALAAAAGAGRR